MTNKEIINGGLLMLDKPNDWLGLIILTGPIYLFGIAMIIFRVLG